MRLLAIHDSRTKHDGFTWIELLMVVLILALLGGHLFSALSRGKVKKAAAVCLNNSKQITASVLLFAQDTGSFPSTTRSTYYYWESTDTYISGKRVLPNGASIYECPLNPMVWVGNEDATNRARARDIIPSFTNSYLFNGQNAFLPNVPGIAGAAVTHVEDPKKTVAIVEGTAFNAQAAHTQQDTKLKDTPNTVGFADGHAKLTTIFWDGRDGDEHLPWRYNPPAGYDYKWSVK